MTRCYKCGKWLWPFSQKIAKVPSDDGQRMVTVCTNCNSASVAGGRASDNQNEVHKITIHRFDESRRLAQRNPARLKETRGQLLSVKCRFCGETFVVGENAVVVTDEDIDWRGSRQPDVIMPVVPTDKAAASASGASVLSAIRRGEERTWCCEKCQNQTPQSYSETI